MKLSKKWLLMSSLAIVSAMTLAACGSSEKTGKAGEVTAAESNNWPEKLTIVQMPDENNPDAGQKNDDFREAMTEYLGIEVVEMEGADYAVGIEALKSEKLDIMLVSPMSYYQAKERANIEPLVTTTSMGNEPYKTAFITHADNKDINELADLKDKTFAFVDPASSSGYMYPKAKLVTALDLDPEKMENPGYFFKTVAYSGKHDTSLMGVTMGDYDAAAVALQTINSLDEAGIIDSDDVKVIGETDEIPNAAYIMRGNLPSDLKEKIKTFYLEYDEPSYFETNYQDPSIRFTESKDSDFEIVKEMITLLGLEAK
ncbi:phosphate/phosphite/phosphonate ABC transporter substrate-binding protein [Enterococcus sp.]|uniref:phosphate/phosphite/phosphonate ABC transporter substrate-binding protein n=1 Tax=Enterococcus sp. TaxID=35783 RepID=UPI002FC9678A